MIYTLGKTDVYESYIATDKNPRKAAGGSVWENKNKAEEHLQKMITKQLFSVYGVDAVWRIDTINNGEEWDDLLISSKLIKL